MVQSGAGRIRFAGRGFWFKGYKAAQAFVVALTGPDLPGAADRISPRLLLSERLVAPCISLF